MEIEKSTVTTSDGISLNVLVAGRGRPLVLLPGWSQTAAQFRHQLAGLSHRYRVIAIDPRGHGDSDKPDHGYRVPRLAKDLWDALRALDVDEATVIGHGMGAAVLWCYVDLFGADRLRRCGFCEQPPTMTAALHSDGAPAGALFTPDGVYETAASIDGPDGVAATRAYLNCMLSDTVAPDVIDWIVEQNLKLPRRHAATLLRDLCLHDWRDVVGRVPVPCLFVAGRASVVPWQATAWCAARKRGASLQVVEEEDGGRHFLFEEAPERFNRMLAEFAG